MLILALEANSAGNVPGNKSQYLHFSCKHLAIEIQAATNMYTSTSFPSHNTIRGRNVFVLRGNDSLRLPNQIMHVTFNVTINVFISLHVVAENDLTHTINLLHTKSFLCKHPWIDLNMPALWHVNNVNKENSFLKVFLLQFRHTATKFSYETRRMF